MKQFLREISRKKPLHLIAEATKDNSMHRTLTATSLTSMGVGSVVGAGIFVITGQAAAVAAGPALAISFVLSAISCFFSGICYAELSAAIPLSGSAYTFTYVAVGEFAAWTVAICIALEYLIATSAVSVGWSGSVQSFLAEFGVLFPEVFSKAPIEVGTNGSLTLSGSYVNLPAVIINVVITVVLCMGVKESATFNNIFVAIKLAVLGIFIAYGVYYANSHGDAFRENMTPYIPPNTGTFGEYGLSGIFRGAGMVYFSYVGFDAVCSMAQECKNPARDLPRGLMYTVIVCTLLYAVVTTCLTGMVKYTLLDVDDPVPFALRLVGAPAYIRYAVDIGAISGLTSVCLVSLMCMPRLVYTLSHDGLLPKFLAVVNKTYRTPLIATIICGTFATLVGGLLPLDVLGELVSAGTLVAFMLVCYSVIAFRRRHPEYPRPFRVPFVPYVPAIGIILCGIQIFSLPPRTLLYYCILEVFTFIAYCMYGKKYSHAASRSNADIAAGGGGGSDGVFCFVGDCGDDDDPAKDYACKAMDAASVEDALAYGVEGAGRIVNGLSPTAAGSPAEGAAAAAGDGGPTSRGDKGGSPLPLPTIVIAASPEECCGNASMLTAVSANSSSANAGGASNNGTASLSATPLFVNASMRVIVAHPHALGLPSSAVEAVARPSPMQAEEPRILPAALEEDMG